MRLHAHDTHLQVRVYPPIETRSPSIYPENGNQFVIIIHVPFHKNLHGLPKMQSWKLNSLQNHKILDWSELKTFADDKIKLTHSHTMTPFDDPWKQAFLKHSGKRRNCS